MSITETGEIQYKIPSEIKSLFTKEFLISFHTNLQDTFPQIKDTTYFETYLYLESTVGWLNAFEATCEEFEHMEVIMPYYRSLHFYDSDLFDTEFGDLLVSYKLIEQGSPEDYNNDIE